MIIPPSIRPGQTIGIVAPAGNCKPDSLQFAMEYFASRGFNTKLGISVFKQNRYLGGLDSQRATDLNAMFADSDVRAVFTARGGYGTTRLLNSVDYSLIRKNPKLFVGFSDTTALQWAIFSKTSLVTFTGLTLCQDITANGLPENTESSLWQAVCAGEFSPISNLPILKSGTAEGPFLGGCLSLICSLLGTDYFPDLEGAILFIEEVNEEPYRIDRMLTHLRLAGVFDKIGGLVVGNFVGCEAENPQHGDLQPLFHELSERINGPVLTGLAYGHFPGRVILPIGVRVKVSADSSHYGTVKFL